MLVLLLSAGDDRYGLDAKDLVEVAPLAELISLPHVPGYVAGLLNYRGVMAPVLDLGSLTRGAPCRRRMSTRIVLVRYLCPDGKARPLGLMAECVTGAAELDPKTLTPSNLLVNDAPYLGPVWVHDGETRKMLKVDLLLPDSLKQSLFAHDQKEDPE